MNSFFTLKERIYKGSKIPRKFDYLKNGELLHDCYYDIKDSDKKIVFINSIMCVDITETGCQLTSGYDWFVRSYLDIEGVGLVDESINCIGVDLGDRCSEYFEWVKHVFDCYIVF